MEETEEEVAARQNSRHFTLSEAPVDRERCRGLVRQGVHPVREKKKADLRRRIDGDNTFEGVTRIWYADPDYGETWSANYSRQVKSRMEQDVFPFIGALPIREVTPAHVLEVIDKVRVRSAVMANLVKIWIGGVFRYAAGRLLVDTDPTWPLRGHIKKHRPKHHPHLKTKEIGPFLKALENVTAEATTVMAVKLQWFTGLRTQNVRLARWEDIDLEEAVWRIPALDMKTKVEFILPLSSQAVELLLSVQSISRNSTYVFPGRKSWNKPLSHETFRDVIKRAGFGGKLTPYGARGTFSTFLHESGARSEVIELCLAHQNKNAVRRAYNHAKLLPERREMMQHWADCLDAFKAGAQIITIKHYGEMSR